MGTNCYTKKIPPFVFITTPENKMNLLKGLFRGDGSVCQNKQGYITINYASSSRDLIEGIDFLLRNVGIVPSFKHRENCYFLNISEDKNVKKLLELFTKKFVTKVKKNIKSPAYRKVSDDLIALKVKRKELIDRPTKVYSMDVDNGYFLTSGGILTHNCFPKDIIALIGLYDKLGIDASLLKTVWEKNLKIRKVRDWEEIPFAKSK